MVCKTWRCCTCTTFATIYRNKIRAFSCWNHQISQFFPLFQFSNRSLYANWQTCGIGNSLNKFHQFWHIFKRRMCGRRNDILSHWHMTYFWNFLCDFSSWKNTAFSRFCTLGQFYFDGSDIGLVFGNFCQFFKWKSTIFISNAKISCPKLKNHVTTMAVVGRQAAFSSIMICTSQLNTLVHGLNSFGRKRSKTHCRNVNDWSWPIRFLTIVICSHHFSTW